ncbi:hypothetical protein MNV_960003 [Candidatus Methanoperedens nitroreducens]|uniref:Uncharacterized protein n=1 Tax=Candidatus Methanoperedens nitratireducens TaxID=1392998 RepID=A0A284VUC7_9EURY|nr:hypothetical protein MNV_960003 [Candidatus Methanoperedens nitroreducens]
MGDRHFGLSGLIRLYWACTKNYIQFLTYKARKSVRLKDNWVVNS